MNLTKARRALGALIVTSIAIIPQPATAQTRDQRAIRALSDQWQRDIAADNVDAIVALHSPDAVVMFSNAPLVKGSQGIRDIYKEMVKTPGLQLHWIPTKIDVTSPTSATEYGTYTESFDSPGGKMRDAGNYVVLWRKVDGKWRVVLDAPSTTTALPSSMPAESPDFVGRAGNTLTWSDFAPPGFPAGGKISVLHGDPFSPGQFVLRLDLPDGYQIPVHWHPRAEYVTVISGSAQFGMGNAVQLVGAQTYNAGDFVFIPARHAHFGQTRGRTVLQITGVGPFLINLGAPRS